MGTKPQTLSYRDSVCECRWGEVAGSRRLWTGAWAGIEGGVLASGESLLLLHTLRSPSDLWIQTVETERDRAHEHACYAVREPKSTWISKNISSGKVRSVPPWEPSSWPTAQPSLPGRPPASLATLNPKGRAASRAHAHTARRTPHQGREAPPQLACWVTKYPRGGFSLSGVICFNRCKH